MFGAKTASVNVSKRLFNTKNTHLRNLTTAKNTIRSHWEDSTLPWIEPGIRLIHHANIVRFREDHEQLTEGFYLARTHLVKNWSNLIMQAEEDLNELFDPADYPDNPESLFDVSLSWPNLSAPDYLKTIDPKMYEEEAKKIEQKFKEAWKLGEQALTQELLSLVNNFADRMKPNPDGTKKMFKSASFENILEFIQKFQKLNVNSGSELEQLVNRTKEIMGEVNPDQIRLDDGFREKIGNSMTELGKELADKIEDLPRRKIGKIKAKKGDIFGEASK